MKHLKKCIVIPDSFKGTLSAIEICDIVTEKVKRISPHCEVQAIPIADGGEGTVDAFLYSGTYQKVDVTVTNAYHEECKCSYAKKNKKAIIEMASVAGLPQAEGRLNPAITTTYGVGELIKKAIQNGCNDILLGLGGSCTNDGGTGMARALGTKFYDQNNQEFSPQSDEFVRVRKIDNTITQQLLKGIKITAMCDITNPLYGEKGAAYIFAPQKGANEQMVKVLDKNLQYLSEAIKNSLGKSIENIPGSGAAGGMGGGVAAFLNGQLKSGIETVLDMVDFDLLLAEADLIITGEGKLDRQSLSGKAIIGVSKRAQKKKVPVIVIAGTVDDDIQEVYEMGVSTVFSINRKAEDYTVSRYKSAQNLGDTVENIFRLLNIS